MAFWNKMKNYSIEIKIHPILAYQMKQTSLLVLVPLICTLLLFLLLFMFAKLNLYYMEANGFVADPQIRDAYYQEVQNAMFTASGYLGMLLLVTTIASFIVMEWAVAPFKNAEKLMKTLLSNPELMKKEPRFLAESPKIRHFFWEFANRVKNGGENSLQTEKVPSINLNYFFLGKFLMVFFTLSIITGYALGIILSSSYEEIVSLALQIIPGAKHIGYFFTAQDEILSQASYLLIGIAFLVYIPLGISISRYMSVMSFVFCRALKEDRFPIHMRHSDVYHTLANVTNEAAKKLKVELKKA